MLNLKTLSGAIALLLIAIGTAPVAGAGTDAGGTEVCTTGKRAVYRHAVGHPSKSMKLPGRHYVESKSCSEKAQTALVLASYLDAPGGNALVAGRSERAIRDIELTARTTTTEKVNLCVAYTTLRQWENAQEACDAAVEAANLARAKTREWPKSERRSADQLVAAAYSNRAVMHWLASDSGAAHGDLSKAYAVSPKSKFVVRNLELTVRVPAQVQAPATSAIYG
jgi:hypothetical protein